MNTSTKEYVLTHENGDTTSYTLSIPPDSQAHPLTILCHGFPSDKNSSSLLAIETQLAGHGLACLRFDAYSQGKSSGEPENITISRVVEQIKELLEVVKEMGFSRFGIFGSSFGGCVAIIALESIPEFEFLVLKSPVIDYLSFMQHTVGEEAIRNWKKTGTLTFVDGDVTVTLRSTFLDDIQGIDGFAIAKTITIPTLVVHGSLDTDAPIIFSQKFAKLVPQTVFVPIEGANHHYDNPDHKNTMIQTVTDWIVTTSMR